MIRRDSVLAVDQGTVGCILGERLLSRPGKALVLPRRWKLQGGALEGATLEDGRLEERAQGS